MISTKEVLEKIQLTQVESKSSEVLTLNECIGEGGQGAVFSTQTKNLLVKLSIAKKGSEELIKVKYRHYESLSGRHDLTPYLAKPLNEIKPITKNGIVIYGYVMELMEDMVSLQSLFRKNGEDPTAYIHRMGSIRRIYVLLRKIAEILNGIHSIGYVYGDLNPNNVFISSDPAYSEVQLIDCDNLMIAADYDGSIYYPGYGAPELLNGLCYNNYATDTWSFAVLAFVTLRQTKPYQGKMVMEVETLKLSSQEQKADSGELPFIDEGQANTAAHALPKNVMESPTLQSLFLDTFGKDSSPITRPTIQEWINAFLEWENQFVKCTNPRCGSIYLKYKGIGKCPFCDEKNTEPFIVCHKMVLHGESCTQFDNNIIASDIPVRLELPISEYKMVLLEVSLDAKAKKVYIKQLGDDDIIAEWTIKSIGSGKKIKLPSSVPVSLYVQNKEQNFLQFPEYSFIEGKKARGVLKFACRGLNG